MALAQLAGATEEEIRQGMASFSGVDRRFDFHVRTPQMVYLSDYAHHPEEIRNSVLSLREVFAGRRITGMFKPHLYTRTRDFYREFAESLSLLDEVVLTEIYPAREQPIEGVTSRLIYDRVAPGVKKRLISKQDAVEYVETHDTDVLVVLGAGDLDDMVPRMTEVLKAKYNL
jgi:UDP-N-acetylmuramate--alanine ligase